MGETGFSTELLDEILLEKKKSAEHERKQKIEEILALLPRFANVFCFKKIYLFGSLIQTGRFSRASDLDIAIEGLESQDFIPALSYLSSKLGREVDLVRLEGFRFRNKIIKEGILWKKDN